jgi:NAD(P)-dependent dehydrogenase (short-subunit alcohol dehydrogenase family)
MQPFSFESTTQDVIQHINLSGKTALITGATSGLGLETAKCLASAGASIILAARNANKIQKAKESILANVPNAKLSYVIIDLSDLNSVRKAAESLIEKQLTIDLLINNAGVMACPFEKTAQGFEMQFGSNHLGHFLFTGLILSLLKKQQGSRVICLSSAAHKFANVNLEDPNYENRKYNKWQAYGEAKSANALFALALNERLKNRDIECFSVHPGMIATELGRHLQPEDLEMFSGGSKSKNNNENNEKGNEKGTEKNIMKDKKESDKPKRSPFKTVEQGAATTAWAATSPSLNGLGGTYLEDCQISQASDKSSTGFSNYIADKTTAEKLWTLSENLVGETFDCQ